ncbi:MAG: arsenate reductase (azurin) large subunit [Alphaproteobacteria bacterium]|nr:arsenate reductase (azurin) large subunit [Alphaproteobacteria bacterium]MBU0803283.1 arsenate reductase (azurin) large subunit [Alphaproteobacteria bacterium]MBU0870807.1 arsenate reductase (azurin) large subunit [Alphaproteobacteria bacterium]MBU1403755.1 arsenate reductase (azurin) large subunit [Alphaproteobacteria bacterium]MBU1589590.1 arsenate reductase (azurin) large subunit [Alphaproteobacteria bacterium]
MAYKRHVDRLPIIPADAKKHNVTCHYCIVGCGYNAYTWPVNKQGGTEPDKNAFGVDLSQQQSAQTGAWYSPSMYNVVKQDGKDVHLVIRPDPNCVVNSGLGSVRGARMAENRRSDQTGTQQQRLKEPMVWRYGTWQPTSWDDALDLVARVTARVIDKDNENDLFVAMFDHGGSAGGYENTWGTGKLYFGSMKVKNCRIHNRPAYNSEVHSTRDMGVGELNYAYEDYELTDTIFLVGANPLETQSNLFLNHMVPGIRNGAKVVIVDPRRTVTVNACETEAGKENVLQLAIKSGTDLALFNTLFTHIADQGWVDKDFIANSTFQGDVAQAEDGAHPAALGGFEMAREACRMSLAEGAEICGIPEADIVKAAEWIAKPKDDGARRKCVTAYEKGIIWGNDNYRTVGALVNIGLATGNIGREGGGVCRLGGHQEGYMRPSDGHVGRPAPYIDQLIISGQGKVHHIWANDHYKTTLNASEFKRVYNKRTNMVKEAMDARAGATREELVDAIVEAINAGGLFSVNVDIIHSQIGQAAHVILPAVESGEMNLTSMNGERRMRLVEKYMDGPGSAKPDCLIAAGLAQALERVLREGGRAEYADQFKGYDWASEEDAFMDGYHANTGEIVTYDRLRAMGNNGVQEPVVDFKDGKLVGTKRLYADGQFDRHGRDDKKALFCAGAWRGLQAPGKTQQRDSYAFLINNGRSNINWQNWFLDQDNDFVSDRYPFPFIEINPEDMAELDLKEGDLVEVYNDVGATQAMVYPTETARRKETFMLFGAPSGTQGNVINAGVNELVLPNYKQTWANIRKISDAPASVKHLSFKPKEYTPA